MQPFRPPGRTSKSSLGNPSSPATAVADGCATMRVLVVEDEEALAEAVVEALRDAGYAVDHAASGALAEELFAINSYDAVVLDWHIPSPTGIELLRDWRAEGSQTPVLMLTGRSDLEDRVDGLDSGADDYLTKPFSLRELQARLRSLLRRREKPLLTRLEAGDLVLDPNARTATVGGQPLRLTAKELALVEYLLTRVDEVVTRTEISEHVWDDSFDSLSNVVDVTVYRLRKKIDGDRSERLLHTVKGVGYLLSSHRREGDPT